MKGLPKHQEKVFWICAVNFQDLLLADTAVPTHTQKHLASFGCLPEEKAPFLCSRTEQAAEKCSCYFFPGPPITQKRDLNLL